MARSRVTAKGRARAAKAKGRRVASKVSSTARKIGKLASSR